jgi:hypothetical protein
MKKSIASEFTKNCTETKDVFETFSTSSLGKRRKISSGKKKQLIFEDFKESDEYYYGMYDIQENYSEPEEEFND